MTTSPNNPNDRPQPTLEATNVSNIAMEVTEETTGQDGIEPPKCALLASNC